MASYSFKQVEMEVPPDAVEEPAPEAAVEPDDIAPDVGEDMAGDLEAKAEAAIDADADAAVADSTGDAGAEAEAAPEPEPEVKPGPARTYTADGVGEALAAEARQQEAFAKIIVAREHGLVSGESMAKLYRNESVGKKFDDYVSELNEAKQTDFKSATPRQKQLCGQYSRARKGKTYPKKPPHEPVKLDDQAKEAQKRRKKRDGAVSEMSTKEISDMTSGGGHPVMSPDMDMYAQMYGQMYRQIAAEMAARYANMQPPAYPYPPQQYQIPAPPAYAYPQPVAQQQFQAQPYAAPEPVAQQQPVYHGPAQPADGLGEGFIEPIQAPKPAASVGAVSDATEVPKAGPGPIQAGDSHEAPEAPEKPVGRQKPGQAPSEPDIGKADGVDSLGDVLRDVDEAEAAAAKEAGTSSVYDKIVETYCSAQRNSALHRGDISPIDEADREFMSLGVERQWETMDRQYASLIAAREKGLISDSQLADMDTGTGGELSQFGERCYSAMAEYNRPGALSDESNQVLAVMQEARAGLSKDLAENGLEGSDGTFRSAIMALRANQGQKLDDLDSGVLNSRVASSEGRCGKDSPNSRNMDQVYYQGYKAISSYAWESGNNLSRKEKAKAQDAQQDAYANILAMRERGLVTPEVMGYIDDKTDGGLTKFSNQIYDEMAGKSRRKTPGLDKLDAAREAVGSDDRRPIQEHEVSTGIGRSFSDSLKYLNSRTEALDGHYGRKVSEFDPDVLSGQKADKKSKDGPESRQPGSADEYVGPAEPDGQPRKSLFERLQEKMSLGRDKQADAGQAGKPESVAEPVAQEMEDPRVNEAWEHVIDTYESVKHLTELQKGEAEPENEFGRSFLDNTPEGQSITLDNHYAIIIAGREKGLLSDGQLKDMDASLGGGISKFADKAYDAMAEYVGPGELSDENDRTLYLLQAHRRGVKDLNARDNDLPHEPASFGDTLKTLREGQGRSSDDLDPGVLNSRAAFAYEKVGNAFPDERAADQAAYQTMGSYEITDPHAAPEPEPGPAGGSSLRDRVLARAELNRGGAAGRQAGDGSPGPDVPEGAPWLTAGKASGAAPMPQETPGPDRSYYVGGGRTGMTQAEIEAELEAAGAAPIQAPEPSGGDRKLTQAEIEAMLLGPSEDKPAGREVPDQLSSLVGREPAPEPSGRDVGSRLEAAMSGGGEGMPEFETAY